MQRNLRSVVWLLGSLGAVAACSSAGSGPTDNGAAPSQAMTPANGPHAPGNPSASSSSSSPGSSGGDAGGPPPKPCGAAAGNACELGRSCTADADCA